VLALTACQPVTEPPFPPLRDTSFDADLDAPRPDVPLPDAPRPDAPRPDVPGLDAPGEDAGDPDFDGGTRLPITIDGVLDEVEWDTATIASSSATGVGLFAGCTLTSLRALADDANVYLAIEGMLCTGAIVAYVDTGRAGVLLGTLPLGDVDGFVDSVLSRSWTLADPTVNPRFAWGTSDPSASATTATDVIGWRELSQDGPHRHLTTDLSACAGTACETMVPLSALGSPARLRIAVRLATEADGSLLALPFEASADVTLSAYAPFSLP
jgi:hypothetical protein